MNEEREERENPRKPEQDEQDEQDGETRRNFLKKLTYVAPLMITFQMDSEAVAKGDDDDDDDDGGNKNSKKKKISPNPKVKKKR